MNETLSLIAVKRINAVLFAQQLPLTTTRTRETMPLSWTKRLSAKKASDGFDKRTTTTSSMIQLFSGKGKRIQHEVKVIPNPCFPSGEFLSQGRATSSIGIGGFGTDISPQTAFGLEKGQNQEDFNDWEVEIVPVLPVSRQTSSKPQLWNITKKESPPQSQEKRTTAVVDESPPVPVVPPNQFYNCVVIADNILTAATETVLDMLVKTITVADEAYSNVSTSKSALL